MQLILLLSISYNELLVTPSHKHHSTQPIWQKESSLTTGHMKASDNLLLLPAHSALLNRVNNTRLGPTPKSIELNVSLSIQSDDFGSGP